MTLISRRALLGRLTVIMGSPSLGVFAAVSPLPKAVFVGHDWGGMVAWQMRLSYPDRVAGVVGVNTLDAYRKLPAAARQMDFVKQRRPTGGVPPGRAIFDDTDIASYAQSFARTG